MMACYIIRGACRRRMEIIFQHKRMSGMAIIYTQLISTCTELYFFSPSMLSCCCYLLHYNREDSQMLDVDSVTNFPRIKLLQHVRYYIALHCGNKMTFHIIIMAVFIHSTYMKLIKRKFSIKCEFVEDNQEYTKNSLSYHIWYDMILQTTILILIILKNNACLWM